MILAIFCSNHGFCLVENLVNWPASAQTVNVHQLALSAIHIYLVSLLRKTVHKVMFPNMAIMCIDEENSLGNFSLEGTVKNQEPQPLHISASIWYCIESPPSEIPQKQYRHP